MAVSELEISQSRTLQRIYPSVVIGVLLDRFGPRVVLTGGALVTALGFLVSGLARSVAAFYLGMGVFVGIGFAALTMTSQATFLSNWFVRKRGMAR